MSESTSWTPGVAAPYYNEDEDYHLGVPGVAAAGYYNDDDPEEDYLCIHVGVADGYSVEYLGAPGVRFVPTDRELIVDYLSRKLRGEPLPTDMVHDGHDAYAEHPKKLVPKLGEAIAGSWYLFSKRKRKYPGGMRPERAMGNEEGHWKATGAEKPILGGADGKEVIGTRRALTFHEDTYEVGSKGKRRRAKNKAASKPSKWKMVEYVCTNSCRAPAAAAPKPSNKWKELLNDFVLCKITNRSTGEEGDEEQPTSDGAGGEPYGEHLPDQQQEGGGGRGGTQEGQQQQGPSGGGAASHGNQQPAPAEAPLLPECGYGLGDIFNVDPPLIWFSNADSMLPIFYSYDAQTTAAGQQQASSSGGGAGSANERQNPPGLLSP